MNIRRHQIELFKSIVAITICILVSDVGAVNANPALDCINKQQRTTYHDIYTCRHGRLRPDTIFDQERCVIMACLMQNMGWDSCDSWHRQSFNARPTDFRRPACPRAYGIPGGRPKDVRNPDEPKEHIPEHMTCTTHPNMWGC